MSNSGKWSGKGPAWGAVLGLAATVVGDWRNALRSRRAIVRLFDKCFLNADGFLKSDAPSRLEVADLELTIGEEQRRGRYRLRKVTVQNNQVPGDDPRHLRVFYFWYNMRFHGEKRKIAISWKTPDGYWTYKR